MAYVGVRPVDVIDLSKSDALNVTTSATVGGDLNISDKIVHSGDTNTTIRFADADTVTVETGGSERMRVLSDGKVAIGGTTAEATLDVMGNSDSVAALKLNGGNDNHGFHFYTTSSEGDLAIKREVSGTQTEAMRIQRSSGRIGIGKSSPSGSIHVETATGTDASLFLQTAATTDDSVINFGDNGNASAGQILYDHDDNAMTFVRGSEAMRINTSRVLFVGRTTGNPSESAFGFRLNAGNLMTSRDTGANGATAQFFGNAGRCNIMGDGDLANTNNRYGQTSDEKLKQDIVDAASQWDDIKAVRVRKFRFKDNPTGRLQIGVVAQELEASGMGGLVEEKDMDSDGGETAKVVAYSVLYMKAVKALQEAMARIETLETKVAALEAE